MFAAEKRAVFRFGGWINLALGVGLLIGREWWYAGVALLLSPFLLSIGYRVSAVFGMRLPWVRQDQDF